MSKVFGLMAMFGVAAVCMGREPLVAPPITDPVFFQPEPTPADVIPPSAEIAPVPAPTYSQPPVVQYQPGTILRECSIVPIYDRVRVVQQRKIHPQAIPMVVAVPNPAPLRNPCVDCVFVEICVPPCDPTCIKCNCRGNRVTYEFGHYAVNINSRLGVVVVDYDN